MISPFTQHYHSAGFIPAASCGVFWKVLDKKYLISAATIAVLIAGFFLLSPGPSKKETLASLKQAAGEEDYEAFAANLKIAYDKNWIRDVDEVSEVGQNRNNFIKVESELYIKETERFHKGEVEHTLRVGTIVYQAVPQSWRFRYLRTRSLEKFGRDAFNANDLAKAEDYAKQILAMMYQIEGANLMADVYIKKIEAAVAAHNKTQATADYNYIKDFEVSADRVAKLSELKAQIDKL